MATPLVNLKAPIMGLDLPVGNAEILRSLLTGLRTFNKAANTATASPLNPNGVLDTTDAQAASVVITSVPNGANLLALFHDWRSATAAITAAPIIRVFGEVPERQTHVDAYAPQTQSVGPPPFAGSTTLALPGNHWIPLSEMSTGAQAITVGALTHSMLTVPSSGNNWYRSGPAVVSLLGVSRVLVTISSAATTSGSFDVSAINGAFGY